MSNQEKVENKVSAVEIESKEQKTDVEKGKAADAEKKKCNWKYWSVRLAIIAILITILILVIIYREDVKEKTEEFLEWLEDNPALGTFCLALIYIVATLAFIPGSLLTLGAGVALQAAFDNTGLAVFVGTLGVFIGAWIGSNLAMLLGRYLFRGSAAKMADKYRLINAIDKVMEKEGLKFTFLLRLCPLIPFNAFNYVMGITSVTFKAYVIGGFGMIPGTIVYVFVGTTIGNISKAASGDFEGGTVTLVALIVGTVLAFAAIIYISIVVKRYLNKQLASDNAEKGTADKK